MKAIAGYIVLAWIVAGVLVLARIMPDDSTTTIRQEARELVRPALALARRLRARQPGKRVRRRCPRARRALSWLASLVTEERPDPFDISEAEHAEAVAYLNARYGSVPPSLQHVIDMGGRVGMPERKETA